MKYALPRSPVTLALGAISAGLFLWILVSLVGGTETDALLAAPARVYSMPELGLALPASQGSLDSISERPLFYASRKLYTPPPPSALPATPPRPDYRLAGTVIIPRKPTVALLVQGAGGASRKVKAGDDLGGWLVRSVETRRVVLEFGDQDIEITGAVAPSRDGVTRVPLNRAARTRGEGASVSSAQPATRVLGEGTANAASRPNPLPAAGGMAARLYRPPGP